MTSGPQPKKTSHPLNPAAPSTGGAISDTRMKRLIPLAAIVAAFFIATDAKTDPPPRLPDAHSRAQRQSERNSLKRYHDFCPQCPQTEAGLRFYRDGWGDISSLPAYKERIAPYTAIIEAALADQGVPKAYIYLAMIESGGDASNVSPKGAAGLWQLMPHIARHYGLVVEGDIDERLDVEKSSQAAAKYLSKHIKTFDGDIRVVIAAYNAGGSNLRRAMSDVHDMDELKTKHPAAYALSRTVFAVILRDGH